MPRSVPTSSPERPARTATARHGVSTSARTAHRRLAGVYVEALHRGLAVFVWAIASASVQAHRIRHRRRRGRCDHPRKPQPADAARRLLHPQRYPRDLNLRSTAQRLAISLIKRIFIGLPMPSTRFSPGMTAGLIVFGVLSALYKITIVMGISASRPPSSSTLASDSRSSTAAWSSTASARTSATTSSTPKRPDAPRPPVRSPRCSSQPPRLPRLCPRAKARHGAGTVGMEQEASYYATGDGFIESINAARRCPDHRRTDRHPLEPDS